MALDQDTVMLDEEMFKQPLDKDYKENKYQAATSQFIESQLSQNTIRFGRETRESIEKGYDEWKQEYLDSLSKNTDHNKIMFGKNMRPSHLTRIHQDEVRELQGKDYKPPKEQRVIYEPVKKQQQQQQQPTAGRGRGRGHLSMLDRKPMQSNTSLGKQQQQQQSGRSSMSLI
jgi:hypothetical protein